jgi:hypothetical protein
MRCEPESRLRLGPGTTDPRHHHPDRRRALHEAHRGNDRRHRRCRNRGDHSSRAARGGSASRRSQPSDTWCVCRCAPGDSSHRAIRPRHRTCPQRPTRAHPKGRTPSRRARSRDCRYRTRHRTNGTHSGHHWIRRPPRRQCQVHAGRSLTRSVSSATLLSVVRASIKRYTRSCPAGNIEGPAPAGTGPVRP